MDTSKNSPMTPPDQAGVQGPPDPGMDPMPPGVLDNLRGMMAGAEAQKQEVDTQSALNDRQVEDLRRELLSSVFDSLKSAGVDLNNPSSVRDFVTSLENSDPDLARLFEFAFGILSPESGPEQAGVPEMPGGSEMPGVPEPPGGSEPPSPPGGLPSTAPSGGPLPPLSMSPGFPPNK